MNINDRVIPVVTYTNTDINKYKIYVENRKKSGIYKWNNLISGRSYIGSSVSLSRRFTQYYSFNYLTNSLNNSSSMIYKALLKYGYSNFSLDILEYCEPNILISREQYYLDLLKPEYNILKIANSCLGNKRSEKTKLLISNTLKNRLIKLLPIKITNKDTNTIKYFANNKKAAAYLGTSERTLGRYKSKGILLHKKYLITNNITMNKSYK